MERLTRKSKSLDSYVLEDTSAVGCMNGIERIAEQLKEGDWND